MDKIVIVDNDLVVALRLRFGDGSIIDAGRAAICRALGRAVLRLGAAVSHEIGGVRFLVNVRLRSFATRVYPWCSWVDCGARFRQRPDELSHGSVPRADRVCALRGSPGLVVTYVLGADSPGDLLVPMFAMPSDTIGFAALCPHRF